MSASFLSPAQLELRARARAAFTSLEPQGHVSDAQLKAEVARLGFYSYLVPSEYGGIAPKVEVLSVCVLREELAYRSAAADSLFAVQGLGSHPVVLAGNETQRREHLPAAAKGETLWAFALTEAEAGSDVGALSTKAEPHEGGWRINGAKRFISNAGVATHYTVFARTGAGPKGLSAFVVPATTPGFRVSRQMELMGEHAIGELEFKDCQVPSTALLGEQGQGMKLALGTLDIFRSTVGAAAVGMARRALNEAISYSKARKQFGAPLAELSAVQALLADSAVELEAARLLVHQAALTKDQGQARVTYEAAVAKLFSTEAAQRIVDRCLQVHGGNGVVKGAVVERLYRDVRALRIYEGASEVQRLVIARHLLGMKLPAGLVDVLVAAPDDPAGYLVAGDWLTSQGDPWGEFISAQCGLQHRTDPAQFLALRRRADTVLAAHAPQWVGTGEATVTWRWGFVEALTLPEPSMLDAVLASDVGALMRRLALSGGPLALAQAIVKLKPLTTPRLEALSLSGKGHVAAPVPDVRSLETHGLELDWSTIGPKLEDFRCSDVRSERLAQWLEAEAPSTLRRLELLETDVPQLQLRRLVDRQRDLRVLHLEDDLPDDVALWLAKSPVLATLDHLALEAPSTDVGLDAVLAQFARFSRLKSLIFYGGRFGATVKKWAYKQLPRLRFETRRPTNLALRSVRSGERSDGPQVRRVRG